MEVRHAAGIAVIRSRVGAIEPPVVLRITIVRYAASRMAMEEDAVNLSAEGWAHDPRHIVELRCFEPVVGAALILPEAILDDRLQRVDRRLHAGKAAFGAVEGTDDRVDVGIDEPRKSHRDR